MSDYDVTRTVAMATHASRVLIGPRRNKCNRQTVLVCFSSIGGESRRLTWLITDNYLSVVSESEQTRR